MKANIALLILSFSLQVIAIQNKLVGTWASKSAVTLTGASFYDPVNDVFIEPSHTGISYSFTIDGYYEEAYYRAVSNPSKPSCPKAILQFQHGKYTENLNGSLVLRPFSVDGRQLESDPCSNRAVYSRFNQTETMEKYQVYTDPYMKITRLDLYRFDGTKLPPMYLAYSPPQMLPTVTLNPLTATPSANKFKRTLKIENTWSNNGILSTQNLSYVERGKMFSSILTINPDIVWWSGAGMTLFGGLFYLL